MVASLLILFILAVQITPVYANVPSPPEIVGPTAVLMDFTTGQVLYDKNMHKRMYPASTTKTVSYTHLTLPTILRV